jgi:hypothetical protein
MSYLGKLSAITVALLVLLITNILSGSTPQAIEQTEPKVESVDESQPPIIPEIRGFGTTTVAGSGRHLRPPRSRVFIVKNLRDSGPGSLRECINLSSPRTCVFEVSGAINVRSILKIRNPYITIAGQTAPAPGITISRGGFSIETHDVLIQHLAVRPGDHPDGVSPRFRDGVSIGAAPPRTAHSIVLDHLSLTWALDENLSTAYPLTHDITISNSLIAEGLHNSIHPKGPHSKGVMIGNDSKRITLYRNAIAMNHERNPYIKPGSSVEMLNNLVYGWGSPGGWALCNLTNNDGTSDPVQLSFIGNIYIPGPWSFIAPPIYAKDIAALSKLYVRDNQLLVPGFDASNPWSIAGVDEARFRTNTPPVESAGVAPIATEGLSDGLLASVGSRPAHRVGIDRRIINDIQRRQGFIKDCVLGCRNAAMAAAIRVSGRDKTSKRPAYHLHIPRDPFGDSDRDGYTNLENWMLQLSSVNERTRR